jgi:photosystem II stability/assembly factor-like uncharacterized protein
MRRLSFFVLIVIALASNAGAQSWTQVLQFTGNTIGSAAYFFNAREGLIGTGHYRSGTPVRILFTEDGGTTWRDAALPNPNIKGQVSDIYFRDRSSGWATIIENAESGWSGVYHSSDGGKTWSRILQSAFPVSIRETSRGVYYVEHNNAPGVYFSSDQGKTWRSIGSTVEALGLDFIDDQTAIVTTQANSQDPILITTDAGQSWQSYPTVAEAWTPYADPITHSFFLASEQYRATSPNTTAIIQIRPGTGAQVPLKSYGDSGLTGGIAGSHICRSIIYAQGRPTTLSAKGMIRSTDNGGSWQFLGGPMNLNDKRFAVTGRGAVVFAFDNTGNVWRTTDGGDKTLSPAVMPFVTINPPLNKIAATICDSAYADITLNYSLCDSLRIERYQIFNDANGELSVPDYANDLRYFSTARPGQLHILYRPTHVRTWTAPIKLTLRQPDGYLEDTTINVDFLGLPSRTNALKFTETTGHDSLDFDSVSTCVDATRKFEITNTGCTELFISSAQFSGSPSFSLASNFRPFILSPGDSRSFLVRYKPTATALDVASLRLEYEGGFSVLTLVGHGYSTSASTVIEIQNPITAALCDSVQFFATIENVSCKPFQVFTIETRDSFDIPKASFYPVLWSRDTVHPGERNTVHIAFVPKHQGPDTVYLEFSLSWEGLGQHDTIIPVIAYGTGGAADLNFLSVTRTDTVSVCADIRDTIVVVSGCAPVIIDSASIDAQNFSIISRPGSVPQNAFDTIIVHYRPVSGDLGLHTSSLVLNTTAGKKQFALSVFVTSDAGSISLSSSSNISSFTCQSIPFTFTVANTTCGTIDVESITTSGSDFTLNGSPVSIASGAHQDIAGTFSPQDSNTRTASVLLRIKYSDGSTRDTTVTLTGTGIGVPPIEVALPDKQYSAAARETVTIPVYITRGSTTKVKSADIALRMNTDLLVPIAFGGGGFFASASPQKTVSKDSATFHFQLPTEAVIPAGTLFEVVCVAYVTNTFATPVTLGHVSFEDATGSMKCLVSLSAADSSTSFVLDRQCGDSTLSKYLRTNQLIIDWIAPNPTSGRVLLSCRTFDYKNDAVIEVYDPLGQKLLETPLLLPAETGDAQVFELDLTPTKGEGVRYLRIRTPFGSAASSMLAPITYTVIVRK